MKKYYWIYLPIIFSLLYPASGICEDTVSKKRFKIITEGYLEKRINLICLKIKSQEQGWPPERLILKAEKALLEHKKRIEEILKSSPNL